MKNIHSNNYYLIIQWRWHNFMKTICLKAICSQYIFKWKWKRFANSKLTLHLPGYNGFNCTNKMISPAKPASPLGTNWIIYIETGGVEIGGLR